MERRGRSPPDTNSNNLSKRNSVVASNSANSNNNMQIVITATSPPASKRNSVLGSGQLSPLFIDSPTYTGPDINLALTSPPKTAGSEAADFTFVNKYDKKLKPDKTYKYRCAGEVVNELGPTGKAVQYKAEVNRPIEEFIYPSLRKSKEELEKEQQHHTTYFGDASKSYQDNYDIKWSFTIENSEVEKLKVESTNNLLIAANKGERHLRRKIIRKYELDQEAEKASKKDNMKLNEIANKKRKENVIKAVNILATGLKKKNETVDELYSDLVLTGNNKMKRVISRVAKMTFVERSYSELHSKLESTVNDEKRGYTDGILVYQLKNELKKKEMADKLANSVKVTHSPSQPSSRKQSMASMMLRQASYRTLNVKPPMQLPVKTANPRDIDDNTVSDEGSKAHEDDDSSNVEANSIEELEEKPAGVVLKGPLYFNRLERATLSRLEGYKFSEETKDYVSKLESFKNLQEKTVTGKKRYAQDVLLIKQIKSGKLPEQLLKRIPNMGNLIVINLSYYSMGDELGACLATSLTCLDMLHTLKLRANRLTTKSLPMILTNLSNKSLVHVDLSENDVCSKAMEALCTLIAFPTSRIQSIELSQTKIGVGHIKSLYDALSTNRLSALVELNLSKNALDVNSCKYIADFIAFKSCKIAILDLSWNSLNAKAGEILAGALAVNKSISTLLLSGNALRDEGGQHIAVCLNHNKTLKNIDLALNNIGGKACFVFSQVLKHHPSMENLNISDNPITEPGARSLFRRILRGLKCFIMMQNCSFDIEIGLFNHSNASLDSPYELDLAKPIHLAIFQELCSLASENPRCSFEGITYRGIEKNAKDIHITPILKEGSNVTFKAGNNMWNVPSAGTIVAHYSHQLSIPTIDMAIDRFSFNIFMAIVLNARTDNDRKNWLFLLCVDNYFTTEQVQNMIDILADKKMLGKGGISIVELISCIWSNIIDTTNIYSFICSNLDSAGKLDLIHSLSFEKFKFNWVNPTGTWRLDMANRIHRDVMLQLLSLNEVESIYSEQKSKRGDTSQKGNWCNFRNEKYNGEEYEIRREFAKMVPMTGIFEFDYVSTTRPKSTQTETINDDEFEGMMKSLGISTRKRLSRAEGNVKLLELQLAVTPFYFSTSDVLSIMDCFSDDDMTQPKIVTCLFNRIDDLHNFDVILRHLSSNAIQSVLRKLGVLNALNPLKPSLDYVLDMKYTDNRIIAHKLLEIASSESGDMLKEHPRSEVSIINLYGMLGRVVQERVDAVLMFTYCEIGERQAPVAWNVRKEYVKYFLIGTAPVDSRMYKIIQMYKTLDAAGMLMMGPLDLQYREYEKSLKKKRVKSPKSSKFDSMVSGSILESDASFDEADSDDIISPASVPLTEMARIRNSFTNIHGLLADDYGRRRTNIVILSNPSSLMELSNENSSSLLHAESSIDSHSMNKSGFHE